MEYEIRVLMDECSNNGNDKMNGDLLVNKLLVLFGVMASADPNTDNIDYDYEKDVFIHKYNKNEYSSVVLISKYKLNADRLCDIMLPHLP